MSSSNYWFFDKNPNSQVAFFKQVIAEMKKFGATGQVRFAFSGYGDGGDVSYPELTSEQHASLLQIVAANLGKTDPSTEEVAQYVRDLMDKVHDLLPSGWELDDGSHGDFVLDLDEQKVYIDYNQQILTSEFQRIDL